MKHPCHPQRSFTVQRIVQLQLFKVQKQVTVECAAPNGAPISITSLYFQGSINVTEERARLLQNSVF